MTTVVIVEPKPLLRLGAEYYLKRAFPQIKIYSCDGLPDNKQLFFHRSCDLLLLYVKYDECANAAVTTIRKKYLCQKLLLLSDEESMPNTWVKLPPEVVGYVSYSSPLHLLAKSIQKALGVKIETHVSDGVFLKEGQHKQLQSKAHEISAAAHECKEKIKINRNLAKQEIGILNLTMRQYEVLVYLAHGFSNVHISKLLNISISTVRKHTQEIFIRLEAHNRNQAVFNALQKGAKLGLKLR